MEGAVNLRGEIVPVLSLRERLGLPARPIAATDHFIVVCIHDRLVVLHVDRALELLTVDVGLLSAEPIASQKGCLPQVAKDADGIIILHEAHHFLSPSGDEIRVAATAPAALKATNCMIHAADPLSGAVAE